MDKQQAITWLEQIKVKYIHGGDEQFDDCRRESIDMAIQALRQPQIVRCKDCRYWKHKYMDYPMHDELPCMHYQTDGDWFCGSGQPIPQEETYVYFEDGSVGKITYLGTLNPEREGDNDVE